ncbi:flavin reductase family protein [Methyloligella sp. 2.7D]|uniref:flavin reductase family protein n=1 Tax=unclassified Methyloligella TaxID=2625955 RepID=UPI00157CF653|nr:flavin reductase family protein [Methyloligella sp. GL2]QKP76960.1 flavin reductase family protein [Methyloligella sp. GL2]
MSRVEDRALQDSTIAGFTTAMAEIPSAINVITAWNGESEPVGTTLSSVTSLSMDPPMVLACFNRSSRLLSTLQARGRPFLLHILAEGQEQVAGAFASKSASKFDGIDWIVGLRGLPELPTSAAVVACEVADLLPGGDHIIVTGKVKELRLGMRDRPLIYHRRRIYPLPQQEGAQT